MADKIKFQYTGADSFRAALTEAGWLGGPLEAACILRQGKAPSILGVVLMYGLVNLITAKGAKDLPRTFVLAVTADRVVAFDGGGQREGEGPTGNYFVKVDPQEQGSWPREAVSMSPAKKGMNPNAVLHLPGTDVPCALPDGAAEPSFEHLLATLGGGPGAATAA